MAIGSLEFSIVSSMKPFHFRYCRWHDGLWSAMEIFLFKFWGFHNVCLEFSDQSVTVCCIKATNLYILSLKGYCWNWKISIFSIQIETVTSWSTTWFTKSCYATLTVKQCTPWKRVSRLHLMIPVWAKGFQLLYNLTFKAASHLATKGLPALASPCKLLRAPFLGSFCDHLSLRPVASKLTSHLATFILRPYSLQSCKFGREFCNMQLILEQS